MESTDNAIEPLKKFLENIEESKNLINIFFTLT